MKNFIGILAVLFLLTGCSSGSVTDDFAKCLTDEGAVFYGSDSCGHCLDQKAMFGDAISEVNYVNCQFNAEECLEEEILYYPSWKLNGEFLGNPGVKSFDALAQATGCTLE